MNLQLRCKHDERGRGYRASFAIWEQNVETVRAISRAMKQDQLPKSGIAPQLVAHLKRCAIALVKPKVTEPNRSGLPLRSETWR